MPKRKRRQYKTLRNALLGGLAHERVYIYGSIMSGYLWYQKTYFSESQLNKKAVAVYDDVWNEWRLFIKD